MRLLPCWRMSGFGDGSENLGSEGRDEHPWGDPESRKNLWCCGSRSWQGGIDPAWLGCSWTPASPTSPCNPRCVPHPKEALGLPSNVQVSILFLILECAALGEGRAKPALSVSEINFFLGSFARFFWDHLQFFLVSFGDQREFDTRNSFPILGGVLMDNTRIALLDNTRHWDMC